MMRTRPETARLRLRQFTTDDVQALHDPGSDPEVIRCADTADIRLAELLCAANRDTGVFNRWLLNRFLRYKSGLKGGRRGCRSVQ